jgi:hypothetical protein
MPVCGFRLGSLGLCPKLRKPKTHRVFGSASMPFTGCKFFASQKTYEIIVTGLHAGLRLSPWEFGALPQTPKTR